MKNLKQILIKAVKTLVVLNVFLFATTVFADNVQSQSQHFQHPLVFDDTKTIYLDKDTLSIRLPSDAKFIDSDEDHKDDISFNTKNFYGIHHDVYFMLSIKIKDLSQQDYLSAYKLYQVSNKNDFYLLKSYVSSLNDKFINSTKSLVAPSYYKNLVDFRGVDISVKVNGNLAILDIDERGVYDKQNKKIDTNYENVTWVTASYLMPRHKIMVSFVINSLFNPVGKVLDILRSIKEY